MALKTARFLALLFTGRALGPAPAWSVESRSFAKLDTNDDGYVRKEEAKEGSRLSEQCERYDRNLDGRIGRAEFTAFEEDGIMGPKEPGKAKSRGSWMQHAGIESGSRSY